MTPFLFQLPPLFDYFATFLWALSGAIVGMRKRYDLAGVFVVALLASTGGSTIRDGVFLHQLPPVLTDLWYLPLILSATIVVSFFRQRIASMTLVERLITAIDAIGVPAFAVVGMQLALAFGIPAPGVVFIGMVNGYSGGMLRDLIVGNPVAMLQPGHFNVSAAVISCVLFVALVTQTEISKSVAAWIVIALFFALRMLSARYNWQTKPVLPTGAE